MPSKPYEIKLDIFEGPMDLLVHLIKKNEVGIYDIPISLITDQYLEYIEWLKAMNIDFAGDFLLMAATLAQIKSKMLLPTYKDGGDEEDPRMEIARPLMEYLRIRTAADQLSEKFMLGKDTFTRKKGIENFQINQEDRLIQIGLFELVDAFQKILGNLSSGHKIDFTSDSISVKERINEIVDILENQKSITFNELFSSATDKKNIIVSFLAILEMVKLNLLTIAQHIQSGIIKLVYL